MKKIRVFLHKHYHVDQSQPAWGEYWSFISYRCYIMMLIRIVGSLFFVIMKTTNLFKQYETSARDEQVNILSQQFADTQNQSILIAAMVMMVGRVFLLAAAWRWQSLCETFFYYETVSMSLIFLLPQYAHAQFLDAALFWIFLNTSNICMFYCNFKRSLFFSFLSLLNLFAGRLFIYEDQFELVNFCVGCILLTIMLFISFGVIHLLVFAVGVQFTKLLYQMKQKDFIVKNLDSGVIVLSSEDSAEVQYANDAASKMQLQ